MIDEKQLQEWRKLADEATPEPWDNRKDKLDFRPPRDEDEEFAIAARTAVPALLDEVERLTVARAELSASLTGALARIRELEQMLETERSTDDTDNGYDTESEV